MDPKDTHLSPSHSTAPQPQPAQDARSVLFCTGKRQGSHFLESETEQHVEGGEPAPAPQPPGAHMFVTLGVKVSTVLQKAAATDPTSRM